MKLKIGNWIIHGKALRKVAFVLFLIGIHIGVRAADRELYNSFSTGFFIIIYAIMIPRILRNIKDDIEHIS